MDDIDGYPNWNKLDIEITQLIEPAPEHGDDTEYWEYAHGFDGYAPSMRFHSDLNHSMRVIEKRWPDGFRACLNCAEGGQFSVELWTDFMNQTENDVVHTFGTTPAHALALALLSALQSARSATAKNGGDGE